jgi:CubicO group peptidase (beta-lactamase class C family)
MKRIPHSKLSRRLLLLVIPFLCLSFAFLSKKSRTSIKLVHKTTEIETLINRHIENKDFNGAILVAKEGKIIYQKGVGFANMEWDIPNQIDTKFRIGSITKQFTAMLIMQLAAENKIDLHTPISNYLPNYPKENADRITIHHLLTHSSGTPRNYDSPIQKKIRPDDQNPSEAVALFSGLPLEFTPGEKFSYSNAGYSVLGLIIETITQKSYEEVLDEQIFKPLGLQNSGYDKHRPLIKHRASGYFSSWGDYYNSNYTDMSKPYAAGSLYSTVEDLFLWDQALYTDKLLPKTFMDLIFTKHIIDPDYNAHYGYGWNIKALPLGNSGEQIEATVHDGVIDGFCAIISRMPSSNSSIILLSNVRRAPLNAITKAVNGILHDKTYDLPKKSLAFTLFNKITAEGIDEGLQSFEDLINNKDYYVAEDEFNIISYRLLEADKLPEAQQVLLMGLQQFPEAFNLYDSLGEILRKMGNIKESIKNYKKSIELNPDNENGLRMLQEMGVGTDKIKK